MEKYSHTPKLRFPKFGGDWKTTTIGELATKIGSGNTPSGGSAVYQKDGVTFIRSQNVNDNQLKLEDVVFISEEINSRMNGSVVKAGDILLNITGGSLGRSCVVPSSFVKGNVNQHVCIIRLNSNNDAYFVQPFLSSERGQKLMIEGQVGGGREGLNFQTIRNFKIIVPSLAEQNKIASFLAAIDEKLQNLKEKKNLLEQYKKGVMQKIFSQELRFKDDKGKAFPKWEMKTLGEIGETYNGLTGKTKMDFGKGKPYIQYKQIFDDSKIDVSRFELVEIKTTETQNKVKFGDIFFTISSETSYEIGTSSVLLDDISELYLNSFCFGYRPNSLSTLSPYFARYLFRNELFREDIVKLAQGISRYNMSKVQLMKLCVKLPCLEEQNKISSFLSVIDEKINNTKNIIEYTEQHKKGLLQNLYC